ncbi:NuA4 histone acetyltransferase subunit [Coniosporium apollinis]|uniref:NuA4 histone acetyltransferase subunit n=2 Tax=Coniosporium TaxID=2810619 RepID=A0ABQ9NYR0_9PEZI|nr:NuA4 histone acetyltransferase subunit [Cladosporium sp. JES 115]KAJ9666460.1 NuA4 histone acetyltransferase subunit [Coniosporium apollinis]
MAQSAFTAPQQNEYAGDEVSAIVLDPGYSAVRAGLAGEDVPKSIVPSFYGSADGKLLFGDNTIHNPYVPNMEIRNPMSETDGIVQDWDVAAKLWEYSITSRLTGEKQRSPATNGLNDMKDEDVEMGMDDIEEQEKPLADSPLLMSEPGWSTVKYREKCIEVAMEDWGTPAFYLARTGVLAAFASGRSSALVIDIGASATSITPVFEGLVLKKGIQKSPLAGNFISSQIRLMLASTSPPAPLIPHYMVASKSPVDAGAPSNATYKKFDTPPTASFRRLEEERVLTEFKESVVQVWGGPGRLTSHDQNGISNEDRARQMPGRTFEMPDGWNQVYGVERFRCTEGLFDAKAALSDSEHPTPSPSQTLPALIQASLSALDVDIRPVMLSSIVLTGGSSLLVGLGDRLTAELQAMYPGPRVRIYAPGQTVERKFASWIGGSILGSLGSFHQMWVSKKGNVQSNF